MKIPNVTHTMIDDTHHVIQVDGLSRNIGGHGTTKEEATDKFLENASKVRAYMGDEDFATEFSVTEMSETMEQPHKQTGISAKTPAEDEMVNGKARAAIEVQPVTAVKPEGNINGDKGTSTNDINGNKP